MIVLIKRASYGKSHHRGTRVAYVSSRTRGYDGGAGNISLSEDSTESRVDTLTS